MEPDFSYGRIDSSTHPEVDPNRLVGIIDRADVEGFKEQGFNQNGITNQQINNGSVHYAYDGAGRMTGDPFKGLTILYNHLNLPRSIDGPNGLIEITYDATGRKWLQKTEKKSRIYAGALEFVKTEETGNEYKMEAANTGDGRLILDEKANDGAGQIYPEYHHKDHLGNTRVTFTDRNENGRVELLGAETEVTQQLDYYPFGLQHEGEGLFHESGTPVNRMQYNGKEMVDDIGLIDYGARWYDPAVGRWDAVDPHAENYIDFSTYHYAGDNPISNYDVDGRDWYSDANGNALWVDSSDDEYTDSNGNVYSNTGTTFELTLLDGSIIAYNQNEVVGVFESSENYDGSYLRPAPVYGDEYGTGSASKKCDDFCYIQRGDGLGEQFSRWTETLSRDLQAPENQENVELVTETLAIVITRQRSGNSTSGRLGARPEWKRQMSSKDVKKLLKSRGFSKVRQGKGSHEVWGNGNGTVIVPKNSSIPNGTLNSIRKRVESILNN